MADKHFADHLARRVGHLVERLTGTDPFGRPKVFKGKAVYGLEAFCRRYLGLRVAPDPGLDDLVVQTGHAVKVVLPRFLREFEVDRKRFATRLRLVQSLLEEVRERLSVPYDPDLDVWE